jgi:hypothetical protein
MVTWALLFLDTFAVFVPDVSRATVTSWFAVISLHTTIGISQVPTCGRTMFDGSGTVVVDLFVRAVSCKRREL